MDTDTEMRYKKEIMPVSDDWNPLSQDLTIGFRTRQLQGLIVFMIDNIQNLLQIHLSKPNELTLIFNTNYDLRVLSINTGDLPLNHGQLVQLYLDREPGSTTLHLLTRGNEFTAYIDEGVALLKNVQYQQYPFGSEIPHDDLTIYEHTPTLQDSFLRVLLGGAELDKMHAKVPGFIGCLSGFKIGDHALRLTDRSIWTWSK